MRNYFSLYKFWLSSSFHAIKRAIFSIAFLYAQTRTCGHRHIVCINRTLIDISTNFKFDTAENARKLQRRIHSPCELVTSHFSMSPSAGGLLYNIWRIFLFSSTYSSIGSMKNDPFDVRK